ncbi:hypothetical protein EV665_123103, partial [Shinella granuli]
MFDQIFSAFRQADDQEDVSPPGLQTFSSQEPLQHPTSGKGVVEMQFV